MCHDVVVYAIVYTRRGSPQHERFLDAYIDHNRYVILSGAIYRIVKFAWFDARDGCVRWEVRRVPARDMASA